MERSINLDADQYDDFLRCLSNLREICNDVDIRGGIIRQRTNDNSTVFEMDLNAVIEDISIAITDLKNKLDMIKIFAGQEVEITMVEATDDIPGYFIFKDQYTSLIIQSPTLEYIDNKFIDQEELSFIYELTDDDLLLETDLSKMITDRVKTISNALNSQAVQITFNDETATISASTQARDQHADFVGDIVLNTELVNAFSNISLVPFVIDHDADIEFKMYLDEVNNVSTNKFATSLGDIDINMYSRSSIIQSEED